MMTCSTGSRSPSFRPRRRRKGGQHAGSQRPSVIHACQTLRQRGPLRLAPTVHASVPRLTAACTCVDIVVWPLKSGTTASAGAEWINAALCRSLRNEPQSIELTQRPCPSGDECRTSCIRASATRIQWRFFDPWFVEGRGTSCLLANASRRDDSERIAASITLSVAAGRVQAGRGPAFDESGMKEAPLHVGGAGPDTGPFCIRCRTLGASIDWTRSRATLTKAWSSQRQSMQSSSFRRVTRGCRRRCTPLSNAWPSSIDLSKWSTPEQIIILGYHARALGPSSAELRRRRTRRRRPRPG